MLTWPLTTGFNLGWQATPFQKATFQYQFRFDGYVHDRTTADTFETPSSTVTNGVGGAYEYRRGGYSLLLNGAWYAARRGSRGGCRTRARQRRRRSRRSAYEKYSARAVARLLSCGRFRKST